MCPLLSVVCLPGGPMSIDTAIEALQDPETAPPATSLALLSGIADEDKLGTGAFNCGNERRHLFR